MDAQKRRELKRQYQQTRPDMGVFAVRCGGDTYIGWAKDLRAALNGMELRLQGGVYMNRQLQAAYKTTNGADFSLESLEILDYDKDESKTDYTADLIALQALWMEKLPASFYLKPNPNRQEALS